MPLSYDDGGGYSDPDALAAIARRLTAAGAPVTPTPGPVLQYTPPPPPPSDAFRFLAPVGNAIGAVSNAVGGAFQAAQDVPVLGGALKGLSAVGDATINTPIGLAALGADQFLNTGLTQAAQQQNAGRPFWELPKTAANTISQGFSQIANDPNADPTFRFIAGTAGAVKDVGSLVAPIPGLGEAASLARRIGRVAPVAEDAAAAASRFEPRPLFADSAQAARNIDAVHPGTFRFTPEAPSIATDTGFRAQVADSLANQRANPTPVEDLANRYPISRADPGTGTYARPVESPAPAAAPAGRFTVEQRGPSTFQVVSPTGRAGPVFSTANGFKGDPQAAAIAHAERLNGTPAPVVRQAAIAQASQDFLKASGLTENPKPAPAFGAPGTAFHGQDIGQIVRTIKATTPYRSFQDFGAAVRSGAPDVAKAPPELVSMFKRGEAERAGKWVQPSTAADIAEAKAAAANGTIPGEAPTGATTTGPGIGFHEVIPQRNGLYSVTDQTGRVISKDLRLQDAQIAADKATYDARTLKPNPGEMTGPGGKPAVVDVPQAPPTVSSRWDKFISFWNLPKALKSAFDLSAPFRQGVLLAAAHPREFFGAFKPMLQAVKDPKFAAALDAEIKATDRPGLYLAPIDGALGAREEAFMSNLANKIPGMSASNRAYTTFLNKLRADVYDHVLDSWTSGGKNPTPRDIAGLGSVINHLTGRGDLPNAIKDAGPVLNGMFFSPRFAISRFQSIGDALGALKNPNDLAAREAANNMVKTVGAGMAILTLAQLAGAKVGADPRSSDFGKIQLGPNTYDIWGGEQQVARYTAQFITGQRVTATGKNAGQVQNTPRGDILGRFTRSKLSPTLGAANDVFGFVPGGGGGPTAKDRAANAGRGPLDTVIGRDFIGQPVTMPSLAANLVTPLGPSDVAQGGIAGLPSMLGVGYQYRNDQAGTTSTSPGNGTFRFSAPPKVGGGTAPSTGTFRFTAPTKTAPPQSQGGHLPSLNAPGDGSSPAGGIPLVISNAARASGIDPLLALAVAQQESGFNPYAVGDNGNSHGLFQENVHGRGAGRAPDYSPIGQTQRFAADVRAYLAQNPNASPGQVAAAVQRPYDPAGYAASVDAIYRRLLSGGR